MHAQSLQSRPTLCDPVDCSPQDSSVHGILEARILEWVVMPFSRGSSRPRVQTHISCVSCIAGWFFTCWATGEATCEVLAPSIYFRKWILFSSVLVSRRNNGNSSCFCRSLCFPGGTSGKEPAANAGNIKDVGSVPGSGRFPGGGHGNPLQYSCLENLMDRGYCRARVHRVSKSQTWLKWLSTHRPGDWRLLCALLVLTFPNI